MAKSYIRIVGKVWRYKNTVVIYVSPRDAREHGLDKLVGSKVEVLVGVDEEQVS